MMIPNRTLPLGQSKTITLSPATPGRQTQRSLPSGALAAGFTLIELLIGLALGLLIVLALTTLFANISRTNSEMAKANAQIENGRFAMQLLQSDIVHGGYWGGYVPQFDNLTFTTAPGDAPTAVPDPCLTYTSWTAAYKQNLTGIPVQSYETLPTGSGCAASASQKANTDVLVVRHAETCLPGVGNCEADVAGKLYFQPSFCELEIAGGLSYTLSTAGFSTLGTGVHKRDCVGTGIPSALPIASGTFADKRKFVSNIYYISDVGGIPTLMRSSFDGTAPAHQAAVPLIEGIEGFRVELGVDGKSRCGQSVDYASATSRVDPSLSSATACAANPDTTKNTLPSNRGDGTPDGAFVRCTTAAPCTVAQLTNVVAVKLYVLARNRDATPGYTDTKTYSLGATTLGPFNDNFKRHVFSTTVRLTNISGRRETP